MYSLKSIFAFIAYAVGTVTLLWGVLLSALPWYPGDKYEAVAVVGPIFGVSMGALALSWCLMRRARVEILIDNPKRWRWTEFILFGEGVVCALFVLLTASTILQ
jgi:hypothetical protein